MLERAGRPELLIDCGHDTLAAYLAAYGTLPEAIFITHVHMDHVAGLEALFYQARFGASAVAPIRLFVPVSLVAWLHQRIAAYPETLAEGDGNFWDVFRLCPVGQRFWLNHRCYHVFEARHHAPNSAFGLCLPGKFLYTGDTRPIPEQLVAHAGAGETIFHDCGLHGNPSHTGMADLAREYTAEQRARMWLYHYHSAGDARTLQAHGYRVVSKCQRIVLGEAYGERAERSVPLSRLSA